MCYFVSAPYSSGWSAANHMHTATRQHEHFVHLVFQVRKVIVSIGVIIVVVDRQTELHHTVDAVGECLWLVECEARGEQGGFEDQERQILDGLVVLVRVAPLLPH